MYDDMFNEEAVKLFKKLEFKNLLSRIQCSDALQNQIDIKVVDITELAECENMFADIIKQYAGIYANGVADLRTKGEKFRGIGLRVCEIDGQKLVYLAYETNKVVCLKEEGFITIEYIPRYNDVSEIISDYWIDMLIRLAVALTKVTIGRIRTRFTQSNALWTQDGELILEEGNTELAELRQHLMENSQLVYPID